MVTVCGEQSQFVKARGTSVCQARSSRSKQFPEARWRQGRTGCWAGHPWGWCLQAEQTAGGPDTDCVRPSVRDGAVPCVRQPENNPPSLDAAIQHALAGLYPPFEATAPTVLGQVFRLLDSDFRGDGLSFLLNFLIPAKRLCEQVREEACGPYSHCLFLHEGWPLCLRDEVVVHLAPLNPLLLRQGDFYLQVEPQEEQSVCMMIKRLSLDLRTVDKKPVPESSYPVIFTQEWLEAINSDFEGSPLHNCLVASENGISPVPWTKIASPEFVDDRPPAVNVPSPAWGSLQLEALDLGTPQELYQASSPGSQMLLVPSLAKSRGRTSGDKYPGLIKVEQARPGEVALRMDNMDSQGLAGDYVALLDPSQESRGGSPTKELGTPSGCTLGALEELSRTEEIPLSERLLSLSESSRGPSLGKWACAKPASSEEEPCVLGSRRKIKSKSPAHDSDPQPQGPCLNVLGEPLDCDSGFRAGVSEQMAASKVQGPLGNPETMVQPSPGPRQTSSPYLSPAAPAAPASDTNMDKTKQESGRHPQPMTRSSRNTSSSRSPIPRLKVSFLKGQRQSPVPAEKASLQQDGPWRALCSFYPPKPSRAKSPGKGSRDRKGRPLLLVSTAEAAWEAPWCSGSEVTKLLSYLCGIPRPEDKAKGLVVVVDARNQPPQPDLVSALQATQALAPAPFRSLLFLGEKEDALQLQALPDVQMEVLTSLKALSHHVDPSQLPAALEGPLPYCHSEWVQFFQKMDPFLADLRQASALLRASIEALEKGDPPGGVQDAARCLSKSKELMEAVLKDPGLLGLQREGGATLAGLQREASRLDSNPDVRSHLAEAAALYGLVDEQLHVLVTASNHLLGRLELRVRLGHLEAAILQVSNWMEQEGSQCLQALAPKDGGLQTVERAHAEFEDFFLQAAAQYRRGLELSKQAAQLGAAAGAAGEAGGTESPELVAFARTQRAFQAKLTHFYMAAERQRTDLETLLHLHRFCKKMTWFHMDCQDLVTQLRLGKAQRASPADQRRLQRYLQRLASEFSAERLTAMGLQVASLSQAGLGQGPWEEAQARHKEIQGLLKKALVPCLCPGAPAACLSHPELRGTATKGPGLNGEVASKGRGDLPLHDSLGVQHLPKSSWPPRVTRGKQPRSSQPGPPPQEAGRTVEAVEDKGPHELPEPAPESFLATLFSWQRSPRQSRVPCPTGGSFSSEGTDSQTSLEDSPQTSPPASL
ncbi:uncharacterized protein KIAA1755 homolog isoform X2 [Marmota marmota marmota]|uniref:uncharacterized protein KIAA1755 homolog isoform X2 n=1 Tax=Marmota marmota marmota TaxID=9994 RepID=UPI002092B5F8|nr:uncharacterized protein KIAA1755 homolog isoform X2 [Marmota marmota marmota]